VITGQKMFKLIQCAQIARKNAQFFVKPHHIWPEYSKIIAHIKVCTEFVTFVWNVKLQQEM